MITHTYLLAEIPVEISSIYEEVHQMCASYLTHMPAAISIITSAEDIKQEGLMSDRQREKEGLPTFHFEPAYLETLSVYRKIATAMLQYGVLLMHGSVIAVDGEAYLFTALSGTGKSTHVRLWRKLFGERAVMVNDDKPLLRIDPRTSALLPEAQHPIVYGTPWDGKHHLSNNVAMPLKAIIYLERGAENEIHEVSTKWIFPVLMSQIFSPEDALSRLQIMKLVDDMSHRIRFYDLHCNMEPEAAQVAYCGMNK